MKIITKSIVSNSDMNKNYRACREKAESFRKIFIFKNNQPEAVLFSIAEYERISKVVEYLDDLDDAEIDRIVKLLNHENNAAPCK